MLGFDATYIRGLTVYLKDRDIMCDIANISYFRTDTIHTNHIWVPFTNRD